MHDWGLKQSTKTTRNASPSLTTQEFWCWLLYFFTENVRKFIKTKGLIVRASPADQYTRYQTRHRFFSYSGLANGFAIPVAHAIVGVRQEAKSGGTVFGYVSITHRGVPVLLMAAKDHEDDVPVPLPKKAMRVIQPR
jgi:hypothetical protein